VADRETTLASHDVSHGGLAVTLAEMVTDETGADVTLDAPASGAELLFHEQPGRVVVETTAPGAVERAFEGVAPVTRLGTTDDSGSLSVTAARERIDVDAGTLADWRGCIGETLDGDGQ
jgi:phosphoribosylformylglycinamidine synthase